MIALATWAVERSWAASQDRDIGLDRPPAWAVAVDLRPRGGGGRRLAADVVVRVTNLGRTPLTITGHEASFDAGAIESVTPAPAGVAVGRTTDVVVHAVVDCGSPQPLRLYPLQLRRADRTLVGVEIAGATAVLARLCDASGPEAQVLRLVSVQRDDARLRLVMRSPTGRTTQVTGLSAGGVALDGRPLSGSFDGRDRVLWIDPPATCPPEWVTAGLPRTVTLDVDAGGPATVTLDAGYPLVRWLQDGACGTVAGPPGAGS
jgi:hypothetical protein